MVEGFALLGLDGWEQIALGVVGAATLLLGLSWAWDQWRRPARLLARMKGTRVGSAAAQTKVKLVGVVRVPEPIEAPLSGRRCGAYAVKVEYEKRGNRGGFLPAFDAQGQVEILLDDGSGEARVQLGGAQLDLHEDFDHNLLRGEVIFQRTPPPEGLEERLDALLQARGRSLEALEASTQATNLRTVESVMTEGQRVAVLGVVERVAEDGAYRGGPRLTLRALSVTDHAHALDEPAAG